MPSLPAEIEYYGAADAETRRLIRKIMNRQYRQARERFHLNVLGLLTGFIVALAFLGVAAWLINGDHAVAGTILGSVDLVALVSVFVYAHAALRPARGSATGPE